MEPNEPQPDTPTEHRTKKKSISPIIWVLAGMLSAGIILGVKQLKTRQVTTPAKPAVTAVAVETSIPEKVFHQYGDAIVRLINPATGAVGSGVFIPVKNGTAIFTEKKITDGSAVMLVLKESTGKNPKPQAWIVQEILRSGEQENIAILRVEDKNTTPTPAPLQNESNLLPGTRTLVLGYPSGRNIALQEAMVATSTDSLVTLSNQTFIPGGGMPVFNKDGKIIAITLQGGVGIQAAPVARLQRSQWEKETKTPDPAEMESLKGIAEAWVQMNPNFDAQVQTHLDTLGNRARQIQASFHALGGAVSHLKAAERAVPWNRLGEPGETEEKIRVIMGFINAGKAVGKAAADCVAAEQPEVSQRTLDATEFSQSALELGEAATRLVALTQNNTADAELKKVLGEKAQAYFQNRKTHEKNWENP